jgi:hypothetical protein
MQSAERKTSPISPPSAPGPLFVDQRLPANGEARLRVATTASVSLPTPSRGFGSSFVVALPIAALTAERMVTD